MVKTFKKRSKVFNSIMDELSKGYKVIKNFLSKEEIDLLTHYTRMKHRTNLDHFDVVQSGQGDTNYYGDPATDSLMLSKKKLMEKETGLELLPTYSFLENVYVSS